MAKKQNGQNVQNDQTIQNLLTNVQTYMAEHKAITESAAEILVNETDPKKLHEALIQRSEKLYKLNVEIRNAFGGLTKQCIGPNGSIADLAVNRRRALQGEKKEKAESSEKEEKAEVTVK